MSCAYGIALFGMPVPTGRMARLGRDVESILRHEDVVSLRRAGHGELELPPLTRRNVLAVLRRIASERQQRELATTICAGRTVYQDAGEGRIEKITPAGEKTRGHFVDGRDNMLTVRALAAARRTRLARESLNYICPVADDLDPAAAVALRRLSADALTVRRKSWHFGSAYGIRTRVTAVRGRRPGPLDECAVVRGTRKIHRRISRGQGGLSVGGRGDIPPPPRFTRDPRAPS